MGDWELSTAGEAGRGMGGKEGNKAVGRGGGMAGMADPCAAGRVAESKASWV